ncbi:MAG: hypothetical protein VW378_07905 [bacterium]
MCRLVINGTSRQIDSLHSASGRLLRRFSTELSLKTSGALKPSATIIGNGVIGKMLMQHLVEKRPEVALTMADIREQHVPEGVQFRLIDVLNDQDLHHLLKDCKTLFMLVAALSTVTDEGLIKKLNLESHEVAMGLSPTFRTASSMAVYNLPPESRCFPIKQSQLTGDPKTLYGKYKRLLEEAIAMHIAKGGNAMAFRLPGIASAVEGGKGSTEWFTEVVLAAVRGVDHFSVPVPLGTKIPYALDEDVAQIFLDSLDIPVRPKDSQLYSCLNLPGVAISPKILEDILNLAGYDITLKYTNDETDARSGIVQTWPSEIEGEEAIKIGLDLRATTPERITEAVVAAAEKNKK